MKALLARSSAFVVCGLLVSTPARPAEAITYSYDALGRLTAISTAGSVNNGQTVSISLDAAGNRTNYSVNGAGSAGPATISIGNASVSEGGNLVFTVTRSGSTSAAVGVSYATSNGTAIAPGDYTASSGTLTFASGESSKTISVTSVDDANVEAAETLRVTLSAPTGGAVLGMATGTGTIHDNDTTAVLSIADASLTEGGTLSFTVSKSGSVNSSIWWNYVNGSATHPADYNAAPGQIVFTAAETQKTITIPTVDDSLVEGTETMSVQLYNPSGATISRGVATGTILDNDFPPAVLSVVGASVTEGGNLVFAVSRAGTAHTAVSVNYSTSNGTAVAGSDYVAIAGTVSLAAGQTSTSITVGTIDDAAVEPTETMQIALTAPSAGAVIGTGSATGTIIDNDVMVPVHRFYKYPRHFMTLSYSEGISTGWTYEGVGFRVFPTGGAGYTALYRCLHVAIGSHFVSTQSNCEGKNFEGLIGYSSSSASSGLVQLHRFFRASTSDYLITHHYNEGAQNGYAYQGALGYVAH